MSIEGHIEALRLKHSAVQTLIDDESRRPHPDDTRIRELKREKLRIKEELTRADGARL